MVLPSRVAVVRGPLYVMYVVIYERALPVRDVVPRMYFAVIASKRVAYERMRGRYTLPIIAG